MRIDKESGLKLKKKLPWGSIRAIAKKLQVSETAVSHVLTGSSPDRYGILIEVVKILEIQKKKEEGIMDKINSLINA